MHGNAILSKYDVDFRVLKHSKKAFDWEKHGSWLKEPRKGERYTLVGTIKAPKLPPILCYCVHLEVFTGIIDRINNFADVFEDAAVRIEEYPHQIISGDLNTMAHSIARLSRTYARDRYRWMSLGDTESNWFDRHVMAVFRNDQDEQYAYNLRLAAGGFPFSMLPVRIIKHLPLGLLTFVSGFEKETLKKARNPGFYDPWDPDEITLHNPRYFGLFKAKLDWTMVRCMEVKQKWIGNRDYSASDHAYLMVKVTPDSSDKMENLKETWKVRRQQWQLNKSAPKRRATIGLTILGLAIAFIVQFYFYLTQNRMLF
ncbi:hypothetical protein BDF20DRAFT_295386 [Mycotypha africana]|uniref:uncharacterized protein n=1 Tax=Mycotypha africana TaxID=64632 RepID=UPI00230069F5|nr:uncharacterized protein BDF20DRAFT_295386 [Mycotypha africana]KAI8987911.1 hypothetical protein BDF20DRAFT_295386 [Mycotypha africana]